VSDTYILTHSGRHFDFANPTTDMVCIEDIATALAKECRYGGHCRGHYSVAQHSWLCANVVPEEYALEALLHDATEAYCKDLPRPLKRMLPGYAEVEERVDIVIRLKFALPVEHSAIVKEADNRMLLTEQRDIMPPSEQWCGWDLKGLKPYEDIHIHPMPWAMAREEFMSLFRYLERRSV